VSAGGFDHGKKIARLRAVRQLSTQAHGDDLRPGGGYSFLQNLG
jgi:hypothetical protein